MKSHWLRDQRGSVLLFTTVIMVFLLVMGGIAIDLTYHGAAKGELQRSMDAAALAGAGNLGFNASVFPTVRQEAWRFGDLNPYRVGTVNLGLNTANAANGDIVIGIWDPNTNPRFTPSLDGTRVNAVRCTYATQIPTSFLRLLGFTTLPVRATATAWSPPPAQPSQCPFPIGLSSCFFVNAGGDPNTSVGCGSTVTFITSSQQSQLGANTAGWIDFMPGANNVNSQTTAQYVDDAAAGICQGPYVGPPNQVPTGGGQFQNVFSQHIKPALQQIYANSPNHQVLDVYNNVMYDGPGWKVAVPVIDTGAVCPPGSQINQSNTVMGWTNMVITQVLDVGGECAVPNHWPGNSWDARCLASKNGTAQSLQDPMVHPGNRGIFGYYDCSYVQSPPASVPGPIAARPRPKLVE